MPKGVRKSTEDVVKSILEKQKERIRKIQAEDREKIKKLNAILAKEKQAKWAEAGADLEKIYKEQGTDFDIKRVVALCEKYWPLPTSKESPSKENSEK
jgi:ribosome recycling factor